MEAGMLAGFVVLTSLILQSSSSAHTQHLPPDRDTFNLLDRPVVW